jgi:hypothetical protein
VARIKFTRRVLDGLLPIDFVHHQQLIWNKGRTVLTRTHYWFQHEPCWYVRKRARRGSGKPARTRRSGFTIAEVHYGRLKEAKLDHRQPLELMRRQSESHRRECVYDPFLGSGTALAAAEVTERLCYGWNRSKYSTLFARGGRTSPQTAHARGDGRTFDEIRSNDSQSERERCPREIAECERLLRLGHPDVEDYVSRSPIGGRN